VKALATALRTMAAMRAERFERAQVKQFQRPRFPHREVLVYYRRLKYFCEVVQHIVLRDIVPHLPALLDEQAPRLRMDAAGDIDRAFEDAALAAAKALPESAIKGAAQSTALRVTEWSADQFGRQVQRVVKVNLYDDTSGLAPHLELFVSDNVKLIKSVAFGQLQDLKGVVTRGARAGTHHTEVAQQIHQQFGVTKNRAALIATDQIGKLNGELNQLRQTNLGVRRYRWSTSRDERVRGKGPFGPEGTEHRRLEGTIQEWKKPPVVNQRTGERGHPGQPIRCRCAAIPIIDDVLADAGLIDPADVELTHPSTGEQPPLRTPPARLPQTRPPPVPPPPKPPPIPPPPVGPRGEPPIDPNALLGRTVAPLGKAQAEEAARLAAVAQLEREAAAAAHTATTQAGREFVATVRKAKPAAPKPYAGLPWTIEVLEADGTWTKLVSGRAWRYKSAERAEADIQSKHMRRFLKGARARAVLVGEEPLSVAPPPVPKPGRKRKPAKGRGGKRSG
jgi:SPP1 gp7 family putative phage head morphogenesis protein